MTRRPPYCAEHALRGYLFVNATTKRHDFDLCERCARDGDAFDAHMAKAMQAGGPYKGMPGSKGGGASADMAKLIAGKAGQARAKLLQLLAEHGPQGAEDLAKLAGMDVDYASPRISELSKQYGLVRKGPKTALTARGNAAHVYELTEQGRAEA